MKIYHNPRCRKSREGVQYLTEKGVLFEIVEYMKEEISRWTKGNCKKNPLQCMHFGRKSKLAWI